MSKPRRDQSNGASGSQGDGFLTQSAADYARDFVAQIELGLQCTPKKLPELLLWDERGHHLFTKIMQSEHYPGTRADGEILAEHVEELVDMLGTGGTLVELGAGYAIFPSSRHPNSTANACNVIEACPIRALYLTRSAGADWMWITSPMTYAKQRFPTAWPRLEFGCRMRTQLIESDLRR